MRMISCGPPLVRVAMEQDYATGRFGAMHPSSEWKYAGGFGGLAPRRIGVRSTAKCL